MTQRTRLYLTVVAVCLVGAAYSAPVHAQTSLSLNRVYGTDNLSDILLGGTGNDTLCEHSTSLPLVQRGGDGFDTACSSGASHGQFLEIEAINCAACGIGY